MAKRPAGSKSSREDGLREFATRVGLDRPLACLYEHIATPNNETAPPRHRARMLALLEGVSWPDGWDPGQCAEVFWQLVVDAIKELGEGSRTCAAVRVAYGLDSHYRPTEDAPKHLENRLERGRINGLFPGRKGAGWPRQLWTEGVIKLAGIVDKRLAALAEDPSIWEELRAGSVGVEETEDVEPGFSGNSHVVPTTPDLETLVEGAREIYVDRMIVTYIMRGRYVARRISEMWIRSLVDEIDNYKVRIYSLIGGHDSVVDVRALLNCQAEPVKVVAASTAFQITECNVKFPKALKKGESFFFATETIHLEADTDDTPMLEVQVTSQGVAAGVATEAGVASRGLTIRLQFDQAAAGPQALWWYANIGDLQRFDCPDDEDPRRLDWTVHGFAEHTFAGPCIPFSRYGVAWQWA